MGVYGKKNMRTRKKCMGRGVGELEGGVWEAREEN